MRQFEASIILAAAPDAVWRHMSDVVRWPEWMETFRRVAPLDAPQLALQRRFEVEQPRLRAATWVVTHLEAGREFTWESRTPGLRMVAEHRVQSHAGQTRVQLRFGFGGAFGTVIGAFYANLVRSYLQLECAAYVRRLAAEA